MSKYYFAKLPKMHWPCELIEPKNYSPTMRAQSEGGGGKFCSIVKFREEEDFHLVTKESELIPFESSRKEELIRKGAAHLKNNPQQLSKFKQDIATIEHLLGHRTLQLSLAWISKILEEKQKISVVKTLFQKPPELKRKKSEPGVVIATKKKKKVETIVMETKRYQCDNSNCGLSFDRIGGLTMHRKNCKTSSPGKRSPGKQKKNVKSKEKLKRKEMTQEILEDWEEEEGREEDDFEEGGMGDEKMPELRIFECVGGSSGSDKVAMETVAMETVAKKKNFGDLFDRLMESTKFTMGNLGGSELNESEKIEEKVEEIQEIEKVEEIHEIEEIQEIHEIQEIENIQEKVEEIQKTESEKVTKPTATIRPHTQNSENVEQNVEENEEEKLIETDGVVHLVPVENADGSISYMLLSLNQSELGVKINVGSSGAVEGERDLSTLSAFITTTPMDIATVLKTATITKETPNKPEEGRSQVQGHSNLETEPEAANSSSFFM